MINWNKRLKQLLDLESDVYIQTHTRPRIEITVDTNLLDVIAYDTKLAISNLADGTRAILLGSDLTIKEKR